MDFVWLYFPSWNVNSYVHYHLLTYLLLQHHWQTFHLGYLYCVVTSYHCNNMVCKVYKRFSWTLPHCLVYCLIPKDEVVCSNRCFCCPGCRCSSWSQLQILWRINYWPICPPVEPVDQAGPNRSQEGRNSQHPWRFETAQGHSNWNQIACQDCQGWIPWDPMHWGIKVML